ncbi:glycosyltransferase [Brumimicrobium aurantiacum]|uniref:Glycosyl transferase family 28 C-terminal domain-containing protein n=1 Tax=Brumimicrobium aurantiacum TaxID=1737063 RepID=A0A3E1F172_9FLAO|nr:glycosyltransferase [Brumimicrobium aurantiacum]RFC55477.1 hypothetical protein DXU93_00655 [Brumimicrobium aurantiacum]
MHNTHIKSIKDSRILLSPLNWGLGHVTRTIPIIKTLLAQNNEVIICCDTQQEDFYRKYFPQLWYIPFEGYPFKFQGKGNWTFDILRNFSSLFLYLKEEKNRVNDLVEKFNPDLIISDQRFGFLSRKVKSIIITHQINLPVPKWNFIGKLWNKSLLSKFDQIWVPDNQEQGLSGQLSNGLTRKKKYIGPCSRFEQKHPNEVQEHKYDSLYIISGPNPYNSHLLELVLKKEERLKGKSAIILPETLKIEQLESSNLDIYSDLNHDDFSNLINSSKQVISRAGYSTIMDLIALKKEAILIPTPGQVEQIYLSKHHNSNSLWTFMTEDEFID